MQFVDEYTKHYKWPDSRRSEVESMNQIPLDNTGRSGYAYTTIKEQPKFLKEPYKHLYETDFVFL